MFDRLFINADGIERIGAPARGLFHHRDKFLRSFRPGDEEEILIPAFRNRFPVRYFCRPRVSENFHQSSRRSRESRKSVCEDDIGKFVSQDFFQEILLVSQFFLGSSNQTAEGEDQSIRRQRLSVSLKFPPVPGKKSRQIHPIENETFLADPPRQNPVQKLRSSFDAVQRREFNPVDHRDALYL